MLLALTLPKINPYMINAIIDVIHVGEGAMIPIGGKLIDLTIDLSAAAPHDCPPVSHYRLVARDRVRLRKLFVETGSEPETGAMLALFTTEQDEPIEGRPAREIRVSIAGIIRQSAWPTV